MKKNEIKIGSTYAAKVTNRLVPVRIEAVNAGGGWDATNLATKKKVRIKSAAKLRGLYREGAKAVPAASRVPKSEKPTTNATRANTGATPAKGKAKATTEAKSVKKATVASDAKPGGDADRSGKKRLGILDAAVQILAKAKEPMSCKAIVEAAIAKELWKTSGKTPHATLHAAIIREIAKKGNGARFEKIARGRFAAKKGA